MGFSKFKNTLYNNQTLPTVAFALECIFKSNCSNILLRYYYSPGLYCVHPLVFLSFYVNLVTNP